MITKYGFDFFSEKIVVNELSRLANQIWKLIPMKENEEDYLKQLENVIINISGLGEIFYAEPLFLQLLELLEGLRQQDESIEFEIYRKTVFSCLSLIQEIKNGIGV